MPDPRQLRPDLQILAEARELLAEAEEEGMPPKEQLRRQLLEAAAKDAPSEAES